MENAKIENFKYDKIGGKYQNWKIQVRLFEWFSNTVSGGRKMGDFVRFWRPWSSIFFCLECVTYCADWYVFTCVDGCVPSQWEKSPRTERCEVLLTSLPMPTIFDAKKAFFISLRCPCTSSSRWLLVQLELKITVFEKSQKMSHSTLRAKRAAFTFWVDKSSSKMPKMVNWASFWSVRCYQTGHF